MTRGISIGLLAEGDTDMRFFKSIIERTFKQIRNECKNIHAEICNRYGYRMD